MSRLLRIGLASCVVVGLSAGEVLARGGGGRGGAGRGAAGGYGIQSRLRDGSCYANPLAAGRAPGRQMYPGAWQSGYGNRFGGMQQPAAQALPGMVPYGRGAQSGGMQRRLQMRARARQAGQGNQACPMLGQGVQGVTPNAAAAARGAIQQQRLKMRARGRQAGRGNQAGVMQQQRSRTRQRVRDPQALTPNG